MAVTYRLKSQTDTPLPVYYLTGGEEQMQILPPRGLLELVADALSPPAQAMVARGDILLVGSTSPPAGYQAQQAYGRGLVYAGTWAAQTLYPSGYVVKYGGLAWVSVESHSGTVPPSVGNPKFEVYSVLDTNVLFGVDVAAVANGNVLARDPTVTGGWKATKITDAQVDVLSIAKVTGLQSALNSKLNLSGGTMAGALALPAANPTTATQAAHKGYADTKLALAGGTMTGPITLSGAPTAAGHATTKAYVDQVLGNGFVLLSGGTMSGLLTLSGTPVSGLHAATKAYADTKLPLGGGTLTGALVLAGAPTLALHPATKAYADLRLPTAGGTMTGALAVVHPPTAGTHAASKQYVDEAAAASRTFAGKVSVPPATVPTNPGDLVPLDYLGTVTGGKLPLSGGTLTGALVLAGAPTIPLHPATKAYADAIGTASLPIAGGAMTGAITGAHGLLQRTAGSSAPLTGELSLQSAPSMAAAPKTGLAYSLERGVPFYQGRSFSMVGSTVVATSDYTVVPGVGRVVADSSAQALLVRFSAATGYPELPVTVRKAGASVNAPVHVVLPGAGGRDAFYTLSQAQESVTLVPSSGVWTVLARSFPSTNTVTVRSGGVTNVGSDRQVALEFAGYRSASFPFTAVTDDGGGVIAIAVGVDAAALFTVGDQFTISGSISDYNAGDFTVLSIIGGDVYATFPFTSTATGQINATIRPPLDGAVKVVAVRVTASPSDPWTTVASLAITVNAGDSVHTGSQGCVTARCDVAGNLGLRLVNTGGARTVYVHVLSAGELHGTVNGGYDSGSTDCARYAVNVTAAAASSGSTALTVPNSHGFQAGDVVDVSGTGLYDGVQGVVSTTSTTIVIATAYIATATTGTVTSRSAVGVAVLDPYGFAAGQYVSCQGITALGADSVGLLLSGVSGSTLVARHPTYDGAAGRTGSVSVLPVVPVTFV